MAYIDRFPSAAKIVKTNFIVAFTALAIGGFLGLIQALHRTGIATNIITSAEYYTTLTAHGILLALVFTTFL